MSNASKRLVFLIAAVSMSAMRLLAQSSGWTEQISERNCNGLLMKLPLVALNDTGITGEARLCSDAGGVQSRIVAKNLVPGYVYTIWFAYIDQPSVCLTPGQCDDLDFVVPYNPAGVFGRTDSVIAQSSEEVFSANVRSFRISSGSQIWLIAHFHGPARTDDNRELSRQLLTAQWPLAGVPAGGAFVDFVNGKSKGNPAFLAIFNIP